jgi:hypothetical protein
MELELESRKHFGNKLLHQQEETRFAPSLPPLRARRATASHARRTGATSLSRHHAMVGSRSTTKATLLPALTEVQTADS